MNSVDQDISISITLFEEVITELRRLLQNPDKPLFALMYQYGLLRGIWLAGKFPKDSAKYEKWMQEIAAAMNAVQAPESAQNG